jgi:AGCS family alanine or glycine:cation symporter
VNFFLILAIGFYFTFKSRFLQFKTIVRPIATFKAVIKTDKEATRGIKPIYLYFSSMGGSIGIGNVGACVTAVSIGGPGGLFWMWVAVFVGMLVKYSEVFLGIKYRTRNKEGGYDGGAPNYLVRAFNKKWVATLFCVLMCIYGAEIYQFKVVEDVFVDTFCMNRYFAILILLAGTLYVTIGGVKRLAVVCTVLMPLFLLTYVCVCLYVICRSGVNFGELFSDVFKSAFAGHAAVGGFAGSTFLMAANHGMSKAVYSGDIGIGYDAVIQSETRAKDPCLQARLTFFSLLTDCAICTLTILLVLSTGQWLVGYKTSFDCVSNALSEYFPHVKLFMAIFYFLAGWTTVLGYLTVGRKSAQAISPKGKFVYTLYAILAFITFSFVEQNTVLLVMSASGGLLLFINLLGIFKLRKDIKFSSE